MLKFTRIFIDIVALSIPALTFASPIYYHGNTYPMEKMILHPSTGKVSYHATCYNPRTLVGSVTNFTSGRYYVKKDKILLLKLSAGMTNPNTYKNYLVHFTVKFKRLTNGDYEEVPPYPSAKNFFLTPLDNGFKCILANPVVNGKQVIMVPGK